MTEQTKLADAIAFAAKRHQKQFRKFTGTPYILHPLEVSDLLRRWGFDEDIQCAGVLHDVVEDTETTLDDIEIHFGSRVAFLVKEVTKESIEGTREERVLHELRRLNLASVSGKVIKLADIVSNLRAAEIAYKNNPEWSQRYISEKIEQVLLIQNAFRKDKQHQEFAMEAMSSTMDFFLTTSVKYGINAYKLNRELDEKLK